MATSLKPSYLHKTPELQGAPQCPAEGNTSVFAHKTNIKPEEAITQSCKWVREDPPRAITQLTEQMKYNKVGIR